MSSMWKSTEILQLFLTTEFVYKLLKTFILREN